MDEDSDTERIQIRNDLSSLSFKQLLELKDELGTKIYNAAVFGEKKDSTRGKNEQVSFKRANKNRPREMCSKRPVPLLGKSERLNAEPNTIRDPRFDANCGEFKNEIYKKNYEFVNDIREKEVRTLKRKLNKTADMSEKSDIKFALQRLENQIREEKKRKIREEVQKEEQADVLKAKKEGRKPWFATKKEQQVKELVKQFEEYKKSGKLGKHLEKRRKKNAGKDRKKLNID